MPLTSALRSQTDQEWLDTLVKSISSRVIDGVLFPEFPADAVQSNFVGSSNEQALKEAYIFYDLVKKWAIALGNPLTPQSKFLDFGCGWGRYMRFFWKDIDEQSLFGVDIDPDILAANRKQGLVGELSRIFPRGPLPFPDNYFDCMIAYSVFTHLPEDVHLHWINELARVAKPGCIFVATVEPRRFLTYIQSLADPNMRSQGWHVAMSRYAADVPALLERFDRGELIYLPTGGGDHREADVYGDAAISENYIKENWGKLFDVRAYIDEPERFWQAPVVARRKYSVYP